MGLWQRAASRRGDRIAEWTGGFADRFRDAMRSLIDVPVDTGADPPVTPPLYAGRHADQTTSPPIGTPPLWLGELNLNPQHRAVAAYGTRMIQQEQEALMASAWEQAGELARAERDAVAGAVILR